MRQVILWLLAYAVQSVGWDFEWQSDGALLVTEAGPNLTRKPRRWRIVAEPI